MSHKQQNWLSTHSTAEHLYAVILTNTELNDDKTHFETTTKYQQLRQKAEMFNKSTLKC